MHQIESLGYRCSEHPHFFKKKKKCWCFLKSNLMNFLKATDELSLTIPENFNLSLDLNCWLSIWWALVLSHFAICGHDGLLKVRWWYPPSTQEK